MKKQLYIIGGVLIAALLLFGVYEIFFNQNNSEPPDAFYTLTDPVIAEMQKVDQDINIVFSGVSETKVTGDDSLNRAYKFAQSYTGINDKIQVSFDSGSSFTGIVIKNGSAEKQISFDELYKTLADGTKYAFDGERLYTNAILSLCGKPELKIELRALDGYDTDGDTIVATTGYPFLYPNISRSDVLMIAVRNQYGSYKVYRGTDNKFYFDGAELIKYNEEMFSSLIVNSTYVLSAGKVKDPKELSVYGLDNEEKCTGVITVTTLDKVTHKILIGNKTPAGTGYYAKYSTKDFVYILPSADLETAVLKPVTEYLTANLVNGISSTEDLYSVKDVVLDFYDKNYTLKAQTYAQMLVSSNLTAFKDDVLTTLFTNKVNFSGTYTNWKETATLGGFTSSDGKSVYLEAPLSNYGSEGNYKVSFGLLRDEDNASYLPSGMAAAYSVDGDTFTELDVSNIKFEQGNKEIKTYSFEFHSDKPVQYVRVYFGTDKDKYIVLDELTVYVDGIDAQPYEGVTGGWKLTSPAEYIPQGKLFVYPNYNFPSDFVTSIASLVGDRVVDYGITSTMGDSNTLIQEKLAKYGLDKPEYHVSYIYKEIKTDIYFSHVNENGNYYCYSIISGSGLNFCTDIIAEVSPKTAKWLNWDIIDYQEQKLVSMYIDSIDTLTLSFDNKDYKFDFEKNNEGKLSRVTIDGKEVDLPSFRQLYISILCISVKDEYVKEEGTPAELLKIKINSPSKSPEIIFYRVTTSKAYYTVDGSGSNYVLVDSINRIKTNVKLLLEGKEVKS